MLRLILRDNSFEKGALELDRDEKKTYFLFSKLWILVSGYPIIRRIMLFRLENRALNGVSKNLMSRPIP